MIIRRGLASRVLSLISPSTLNVVPTKSNSFPVYLCATCTVLAKISRTTFAIFVAIAKHSMKNPWEKFWTEFWL